METTGQIIWNGGVWIESGTLTLLATDESKYHNYITDATMKSIEDRCMDNLQEKEHQ
jgi:hypothetical protein